MINLHTDFEVPNFTGYRNMKGVAKCRKWGGLGSLGRSSAMSQFDRACTTSYSSLIDIMHLSCAIFESALFVKICQLLPTLHVFGAPAGVTSFEFHQNLWHQKTTVLGLSCGVV